MTAKLFLIGALIVTLIGWLMILAAIAQDKSIFVPLVSSASF